MTKDLLITPPKQIRKWSDHQLPVRKSKPTVWMYFYFLWKPWLNTLLCFYFVGIEEETWQCSMAQDQDKRRFSWIFSTDRTQTSAQRIQICRCCCLAYRGLFEMGYEEGLNGWVRMCQLRHGVKWGSQAPESEASRKIFLCMSYVLFWITLSWSDAEGWKRRGAVRY